MQSSAKPWLCTEVHKPAIRRMAVVSCILNREECSSNLSTAHLSRGTLFIYSNMRLIF